VQGKKKHVFLGGEIVSNPPLDAFAKADLNRVNYLIVEVNLRDNLVGIFPSNVQLPGELTSGWPGRETQLPKLEVGLANSKLPRQVIHTAGLKITTVLVLSKQSFSSNCWYVAHYLDLYSCVQTIGTL
jgi:hypothetical protein